MSSDATTPILLAPDAPSRSIREAVERTLAEVPRGDKGGVQVSFTHYGATAKVFVRVKNLESGAFVDRTWTGDVTAGGYISLRW